MYKYGVGTWLMLVIITTDLTSFSVILKVLWHLTKNWTLGGWHSTEVAFALLILLARVWFSVFTRFFREIQISWCRRDLSTAVHCLVCVDSAWKSLILDQTHLVLASGKLVLEKQNWTILTKDIYIISLNRLKLKTPRFEPRMAGW